MPTETPRRIRRVDLWPVCEKYDLPAAEIGRMLPGIGSRLARNHRDPTLTVSRAEAITLLGELELDLTHPDWGEHRAALRGDPDAHQHPQYRGARDTATADRLHAAAVQTNGERILQELGL